MLPKKPATNVPGALVVTDGAVIRLYRSKAAQDDAAEVHILPGLAIAAVNRWAVLAGLWEGAPLFRPINKAGGIGEERLTELGWA